MTEAPDHGDFHAVSASSTSARASKVRR